MPRRPRNRTRRKSIMWPLGLVLDFAPQWLGDKCPKSMKADNMTHAVWVASWWSRALTQVAAQAFTKEETLSFENLLVQFLNANKVGSSPACRKVDHHTTLLGSGEPPPLHPLGFARVCKTHPGRPSLKFTCQGVAGMAWSWVPMVLWMFHVWPALSHVKPRLAHVKTRGTPQSLMGASQTARKRR